MLVCESQAEESRRKTRGTRSAPIAARTWRLVGTTRRFLAAVAVTSLLMIAALEALYRHSQTHTGIIAVLMEDRSKYWWSLVPTLAMVLLGLCYASAAFGVLLLHPFRELRRHRARNITAMEYDPLRGVALVALPRAVKAGHLAVATALVIPLLTPLLSVVASGLYTTQRVNSTQTLHLEVDGWFDLALRPPSNFLTSLESPGTKYLVYNDAIQYSNLSFPRGTFDEFAFAPLNWEPVRELLTANPTGSLALLARIPAARAQPNCSVLQSQCTIWDEGTQVHARVPAPLWCKAQPDGTTPPNASLSLPISMRDPVSPDNKYFGLVTMPRWDLNRPRHASGRPLLDDTTPDTVCHDGLQHHFLLYGSGSTLAKDPCVILHCQPYVEALYVDARLQVTGNGSSGLDVQIDPGLPPRPTMSGTAAPQLWDTKNRSSSAIPFPQEPGMFGTDLDRFFTALTTGYEGIPAGELIGADPIRIARMLRRIEHVYAQMTAQGLNFNQRASMQPAGSNTSTGMARDSNISSVRVFASEPAEASMVINETFRLVQNGISTRILQGLLAALTACCIASAVMAGRPPDLPMSPGSIAGRMHLLAGSDLLERLRRLGAEQPGWGLDRIRTHFGNETFALGWWSREGDDRYGIDILGDRRKFHTTRSRYEVLTPSE
jgi:hypothetical protein